MLWNRIWSLKLFDANGFLYFFYLFSYVQKVQILLKLWSNGFSLDDGELRPYNDPPNAQFLESVKRG